MGNSKPCFKLTERVSRLPCARRDNFCGLRRQPPRLPLRRELSSLSVFEGLTEGEITRGCCLLRGVDEHGAKKRSFDFTLVYIKCFRTYSVYLSLRHGVFILYTPCHLPPQRGARALPRRTQNCKSVSRGWCGFSPRVGIFTKIYIKNSPPRSEKAQKESSGPFAVGYSEKTPGTAMQRTQAFPRPTANGSCGGSIPQNACFGTEWKG